MKTTATLVIAALTAAGCSTANRQTAAQQTEQPEAIPAISIGYVPQAEIYKTNGDYTNNVPVTIDRMTGKIASYPAPSDLTDTSAPLPLANGYMLDRLGIGVYTVFTRYTYDEYRALPEAPSPTSLADSVIPGSGVAELLRLPMTQSEAEADTAAVNRIIRDGFPGCTNIPVRPLRQFKLQQ